MKQYHDLLLHVMAKGHPKDDRTGTGTISTFGYQMRFDLAQGFPLVTTKKIHWKSVVHESLWFLKGDTNIKYLNDNGVHIWDKWADSKGDLGPIYGQMWRGFGDCRYSIENTLTDSDDDIVFERVGVDQITNVIKQIKTNPDSRRLIVTAWNPSELDEMALQPCHIIFQFYVNNGALSCQLYQRSCDIFLGCPFNIASYSLLTHMIAHVCGLRVGEFIHTIGDAHLYNNHYQQANLQLSRITRQLPKIVLNDQITNIFDFKYGDIELVGYDPHDAIRAEVAV